MAIIAYLPFCVTTEANRSLQLFIDADREVTGAAAGENQGPGRPQRAPKVREAMSTQTGNCPFQNQTINNYGYTGGASGAAAMESRWRRHVERGGGGLQDWARREGRPHALYLARAMGAGAAAAAGQQEHRAPSSCLSRSRARRCRR
jgi:hypothetical protein